MEKLCLFHISEECNIKVFHPRIPNRKELDQSTGLVWALCERTLPSFLTPRNCPSVAWHIGKNTNDIDIEKHIPKGYKQVTIIENSWLEILENTTLYIYEFDPASFVLQDEVAGYYVSRDSQIPINKFVVKDLRSELEKYNTALMTMDNLWNIADEIQKTTLNWSICRFAFAKERTQENE